MVVLCLLASIQIELYRNSLQSDVTSSWSCREKSYGMPLKEFKSIHLIKAKVVACAGPRHSEEHQYPISASTAMISNQRQHKQVMHW